MKTSRKTTRLVQMGLLIALIGVLALTPLGYIPIGLIRATTIHIPVIIGAILLGPKMGAILGGVFGLTSLIVNTVTPTPASFVFSPLIPVPGSGRGSLLALVVSLVPRILIGLVAGCLYRICVKCRRPKTVACVAAGFFGSMTNTILVMGGIYIFFGRAYAAAKSIPYETLLASIALMIGINGMIEAVVAAILSTCVARALMKYTTIMD